TRPRRRAQSTGGSSSQKFSTHVRASMWVLANPPYVRMELFKDQKPVLRKNFPQVHADRADLYVYFYGRALQLLRAGGMLVFISSNEWLRSGYGAKLRQALSETADISSITDFGEIAGVFC